MKKILESNLGIWSISILPTIITYITSFNTINMNGFNQIVVTHLPFIISMLVLVVSISILYIRKSYLKTIGELKKNIEGIKQYTDEIIMKSDTISDYTFSKHDEQLQIFLNALYVYTGGKFKRIKRANTTDSEKILFKTLSVYETQRMGELKLMLNKDFEINKNLNEENEKGE